MKLLADTSALLALLFREDQFHAAAAAFPRDNPGARFLLTDLILGEVATRVRARADAARAVHVSREILRSKRHELVLVDTRMVTEALVRMERFHDKKLSFADCASFAVMDRVGLRAAFTFDADFRDCGYTMLP